MHINPKQIRVMRRAGFKIYRAEQNAVASLVYWRRGPIRITLMSNSTISLNLLVKRVADQTIYWNKKGIKISWATLELP